MKFDCGPTPEEREETRKERNRRIRTAEREYRRNWHVVFAWFPTRVASGDCRWLEVIQRREVQTGEKLWEFGFGCPPYYYAKPKPVYGWEYRACQ